MATETWELRIGGTDLCEQRIHLDITDGRATIHMTQLEPLLRNAGWVRGNEPVR